MSREKIIILGAGLAGLSAAYHLKKDYEIFEKEDNVGGLCRSKRIDGFTFDCDGHLLHFKNKYTLNLIRNLLNGRLLKHQRNSWIFSKGVYTYYPFQANSYGLPPEINKECILGLIKAKYTNPVRNTKLLQENNISNGANGNGRLNKDSNFEDWIFDTFGEGIAKHFMIPYNVKFWTVPPDELTCEWIDGYIPVPTLEEAIDGAISKSKKKLGYNALFWYPEEGGIERIPSALSERVKEINASSEAIEIDIARKKVRFKNGRKEQFDKLISTMPLPEMSRIVRGLPKDIASAFKKLRYTSIFNLNLGIDRSNLSNRHWIYFPEEEYVFYRVGFPHNFSSRLIPANKSSLYVEVSYSQNKPLNKENIVNRIIKDLTKAKILSEEDEIIAQDANDIKYGYILYDRNYRNCVGAILDFLARNNIYSIGRYGSWRYMSMEDVILDGRRIAAKLCGSGFLRS